MFLFRTNSNVFVFLFPVLGLKLQGELTALPSLSSGQPFARHDRSLCDEDVFRPLFGCDLLNEGEELVGERGSRQISFGDLSISVALCLLVLRDVAETSIQPVVTVSLCESMPSETKPEVVRLDDLGRLLCPDQVKQRGVEALSCEFHELAPELSC